MNTLVGSGPVALGALHVDTPDLALAQLRVECLATENGFELERLHAEPYTKLGMHARVTFRWRLPDSTQEDGVATEFDRFCASVAGPARPAHRIFHKSGIASEAPGIHDERIIDARTRPFARPEFLWLHIEVDTSPEAQAAWKTETEIE